MTTLPGATYANPGQPLYQPYGSGATLSSFSGDLFTWTGVSDSNSQVTFDMTFPSTTNISMGVDDGTGTQVANLITIDNAGDTTLITPGAFNVQADYFSTQLVSCDYISTSIVDLDGQTLTANATELLLNGVPIATTSNLSSIADWAYEPAISSVNMNGNPLLYAGGVTLSNSTAQVFMGLSEAQSSFTISYEQPNILQGRMIMSKNGGIQFGDNNVGDIDVAISSGVLYALGAISTPQILAGSGVFTDISTQTLTAFSTVHIVSTISSLVLEGQLGVFSTLVAGNMSTPSLLVSSINGAEFTSTSITVQVAGVSSLVANSISSVGAEIRNALVSTIQFNPSANFSPNLDVNLGLGNLFGNLGGAALGGIGVLVGGAALGTGIAALSQTRQTNNINSNSYELVNGTTQLQISTLGTSFSTVYRFVSSPAENVPGEEYFVSTIHSPGVAIRSVSDPLNTISAPTSTIQSFGQWVALDANLPIPSSVSTFQQLFTSSLAVSTINMNNGTQFQRGAVYGGGASGVSTTELFWYGASPPLDGDLRVGGIVLSGSDVGGLNYSKDVLVQNQNNGNRITVFPGSSTIAYLSDIPAAPSTVSSFRDVITSSLTVSSLTAQDGTQINMNNSLYFSTGVNCDGGGTGNGITGGDLTNWKELNVGSAFTDTIGSLQATQITFNDTIRVPAVSTNALNTSSILISSTLINVSSQNLYFTGETSTILQVSTDFGAKMINGSRVSVKGTSGGGNPYYITSYTSGNFVATQYDVFGSYGEFRSDGNTSTTTITNYAGAAASGIGLKPAVIDFTAPGTTQPMTFSTNTLLVNQVSTASALTSSLTFSGASTIQFATVAAAGGQGQPASRLAMTGCDLDLGQNDLWCQQVRVGAGNPGGSAQTEVIFYSPDASTLRGFGIGGQDRTIRVVSTVNSGTGGYVLDTNINPPFFSTLAGTSTALMALFPSTNLSTIGVSTISIMPPLNYFASVYGSTSQTVAGANTSTVALWNTTSVNTGGFTVGISSITVPVAGTYEIATSFQFATTSGGTNLAQFWLTKNGAAVPQTNSQTTVANNADNLGNVSIFDTAAAGDRYGWMFYSADANMTAKAVAAGATPAIPSVIVNIRRLG